MPAHALDEGKGVVAVRLRGREARDGRDGSLAGGDAGRGHAVEYAEAMVEGEVFE